MLSRLPRWLKIGIAGLVPLAIIIGAFLGYLQASGNFHEVIPGELYRSAQLSSDEIGRYQKDFGIRSIINLRGENDGEDWYDQEIAEAKDLGVTHIDFRMSSGRMLAKDDAMRLIALMRSAPKPLLIHCQAGADRSGLAASLYLAAIAGMSEEDAEAQLSLRFGHVGIPWVSQTYAMDETWEALETWLGFDGS